MDSQSTEERAEKSYNSSYTRTIEGYLCKCS